MKFFICLLITLCTLYSGYAADTLPSEGRAVANSPEELTDWSEQERWNQEEALPEEEQEKSERELAGDEQIEQDEESELPYWKYE